MHFLTYLFLFLWKDEPWIFWSMTPTRPVRFCTLHVVPRWMSRKRRSFWPRGAHQVSRYYIVQLYCPREDRIKFRMIVLSHLWWHLPFGNRDVSITWSYLLLPDDVYMGKCEWKLYVVRKETVTEWCIYEIAKLSWVTAIFVGFIKNNFSTLRQQILQTNTFVWNIF